MIPSLIVPVINHPDLLAAMVASIDHPIGTLLVIDNSPTLGVADDIEHPALVVTEPPRNLGVAASWNLGIKSTDPWWAIANADLTFGAGDLARLEAAMAAEPEAVHRLCEWGAFGIGPMVIDRVGLFDENFHPIYFEDTDYEYRCRLAGVAVRDVPSGVSHVGSVSYRGNVHAADNARTFPANAAYYERKWGGPRGAERYRSPFDSGLPVWAWRLETARLTDQRWRP